jgi:endonuclease YncB( thermonuclease family)
MKVKKYYIFFFLILLFSQNILLVNCSSGEFQKTVLVEWVIDGDTFRTSDDEHVRLADINTPEVNQTGYWEATNYMIDLIKNKVVYLDVDNIYTYDDEGQGDRYVCVVYVDFNQSHYLNVNKALLENNLAVIWDHYNEFNPNTWTLYVNKNDIPEFPPWIILPILLIASIVIIVCKKKLNIL